MKPTEFFASLEKLGLTQPTLRDRLNDELGTSYYLQDVNKWASGRRPVPLAVAVWLRLTIEIERLKGRRRRRAKAASQQSTAAR